MDSVSEEVPEVITEEAVEPMEITPSDEATATQDEREKIPEITYDQAEGTTKDTNEPGLTEMVSRDDSNKVTLVPLEGNPKQAKAPLRKRRRPPQQLVLLPSMTVSEALETLNYNLKLSLVIGFQDTTLALRLLRDMMDLNFTTTDIENVKDLVSTLRKVRHFKHNSRVRSRADELYTQIKSLYVIGEVRPVHKPNTKHKPSHLIMKINEGARPVHHLDNTNKTQKNQESATKDKAKTSANQESTIKDKENQKPVQPVRRSLRNRKSTTDIAISGTETSADQVVPSSSQ